MQQKEKGFNKQESFILLFKEKIEVPEKKWITVSGFENGYDLKWRVDRTGLIKKRIEKCNTYKHWDIEFEFHKKLPGIHKISRAYFETLLKEDHHYFENIRNKILSMELDFVNERTTSIIDLWLKEFNRNFFDRDIMLLVRGNDSESLLELRHGSRKAFLPAGHAAKTILTFGHKFLNLQEARKLVKQFHTKTLEKDLDPR